MTEHTDTPVSDLPESEPTPAADPAVSGAEDVAVAVAATVAADGSAAAAAGEEAPAEGTADRSAEASDASDAGDASADNVPTHDATPVADNTVSEFTPEFLEDAEFRSALEAMLLVVDAPAPVEQLAAALDDTTERVEGVLRELSAELSARGSGIDLRFVGDGWRFYTRSEYAPYVERVLLDGARTKLTRAALETLAVVAYRQPVTRTRVSAVRGVNVDGVMRTLLARGLIAEAGVDPETNGTTYSTTELFLERIGLASLTDLPPLAPLLPGVDLIDEINESLDTDPRYTKLKKPAEADLDLGSED